MNGRKEGKLSFYYLHGLHPIKPNTVKSDGISSSIVSTIIRYRPEQVFAIVIFYRIYEKNF